MDKNKKIAQLIIARLDGKDVHKKFQYYQSLVKKGIGGFIVFGGKLKDVSEAIKKLQKLSEIPLFITSDLERGLGQQIEGGTLFPPAMAIGQAINPKNKDDINLLRNSINIIAQEAKACGINVIFAPVLDINTNPQNPIISVRAFGENPEKVSWFGNEFIKGFQKHRIIACAKHFPGHGDTSVDSHIRLPIVKADMKRLEKVELHPFKEAIKSGVKMVMVGHLKVPAIDSRFPSSLSEKTIKGLLKTEMKFKGLVVTDAMNMQAIRYPEEKACLMALNAGADIILHPSEPERIIDYFSSRWNEIEKRVDESYEKIIKGKKELVIQDARYRMQDIGTKANWDFAYKLTKKSISIVKNVIARNEVTKQSQKGIKNKKIATPRNFGARNDKKEAFSDQIAVLIIDDDNNKSGKPFINTLKARYKNIETYYVDNKTISSKNPPIPPLTKGGKGGFLIIAIFSKISAWKGRSGLSRKLKTILKKTVKASRHTVIVGFCSPYLLKEFKAGAIIEAYSDSKQVQEIVGEILSSS
ncbi:MAG: glycoside hydrolase family 3 protein [Nitrospirae bacterium]|nr:glycoside hydrolase family 3 protein [Nitrospirota bacterium]